MDMDNMNKFRNELDDKSDRIVLLNKKLRTVKGAENIEINGRPSINSSYRFSLKASSSSAKVFLTLLENELVDLIKKEEKELNELIAQGIDTEDGK